MMFSLEIFGRLIGAFDDVVAFVPVSVVEAFVAVSIVDVVAVLLDAVVVVACLAVTFDAAVLFFWFLTAD